MDVATGPFTYKITWNRVQVPVAARSGRRRGAHVIHPDERVRDFLASGLSAEQAGKLRLTLDDVVGARTPSAASRARRQPIPGYIFAEPLSATGCRARTRYPRQGGDGGSGGVTPGLPHPSLLAPTPCHGAHDELTPGLRLSSGVVDSRDAGSDQR